MPELHSSSASAGALTAVMRAHRAPPRPRVLRAALVREGRIVEERTLEGGDPITVGPNEKSTFVVEGAAISAPHRLFEHTREGWVLEVPRGAKGRVDTGEEVLELRGEAKRITLGEAARGKLRLGEALFLFHLVEPAPVVARARLAPALEGGGALSLDWTTTIIAGFSFLFHFGALGSVYADWTDEVVDDGASIALAVEGLHPLPPPPKVETPDDDRESAAKDKDDKSAPDAKGKAPEKTGATRSGGSAVARAGGATNQGAGERVSNERAAALSRELEGLDATMVLRLGANGSSKSAIGAVMDGNSLPAGMLDGVAERAGGARLGDLTGLNRGTGSSGIVKPGAGARGGFGPDGEALKADGKSNDSGKAAEVKKPVGAQTTVGSPSMSGGMVADANRVVAGMRGGFRACYRRGLDEDPNMRGSVRIVANIGSNGEVRSVQAAGAAGLSAGVVACVKNRVASAQFSAPDGGSATVVIPVGFEHQ